MYGLNWDDRPARFINKHCTNRGAFKQKLKKIAEEKVIERQTLVDK